MGLFDEIKRSLEEAINEAQRNTPAPRRKPQPQRPSRPQQRMPQQPAPVPFEDDLETAQSRDHQQRVAQRQQQIRQDAQQELREKEEARRKELARKEQAAQRARAQEAARQRKIAEQQQLNAQSHRLKSDNLRELLRDPGQFKQAVILTELLGKPVAKRDPRARRAW